MTLLVLFALKSQSTRQTLHTNGWCVCVCVCLCQCDPAHSQQHTHSPVWQVANLLSHFCARRAKCARFNANIWYKSCQIGRLSHSPVKGETCNWQGCNEILPVCFQQDARHSDLVCELNERMLCNYTYLKIYTANNLVEVDAVALW